MTLFINEHDVARLINDGHATMGDFVDAVEGAYTDQGRGDFAILPRQNFEVERPGAKRPGSLKIGGGLLKGVGVMGASLYAGGYGGMNLWITLYDTATGKVPAILHGAIISKMKTGATAALAARYMARKDAETVGMIGCGQQARTQLLGLCAVRPIKHVKVFSPTPERREAFAAFARDSVPGLEAEAVADAETAVRDSDILVTATTAREPVIKADWIAPGTHGSIIGAHYPTQREIDTETLKRGRIIVDDLDQAFFEKGEILIPLKAGEVDRSIVAGSIGDVLVNRVAGRENESQVTLFLSGGTALEYMGVSAMLAEKARAAGIGQELRYDECR